MYSSLSVKAPSENAVAMRQFPYNAKSMRYNITEIHGFQVVCRDNGATSTKEVE
jgi:hypothetical protein